MENNHRPQTISEIVSKGFDILVKNIVDVLIIGAIFIVPVAIFKTLTSGVGVSVDISYVLNNEIPKISYTWYGVLISLANYLLSFLFGIYGTSSLVKLLYDRLKGYDTSWREAISYSLDRKGRIFIVNLVLALICIGIGIVVMIVGTILVLTLSVLGEFVFIFAIFVGMIFVFTLLPLYISVLVIKDCESSDAYKLTNSLFKGNASKRNLIRIIGIGAICCIISLITGKLDDIPYLGSLITSFIAFFLGAFVNSCNNLIVEEELPEFNFNDYNNDSYNNNGYGDW